MADYVEFATEPVSFYVRGSKREWIKGYQANTYENGGTVPPQVPFGYLFMGDLFASYDEVGYQYGNFFSDTAFSDPMTYTQLNRVMLYWTGGDWSNPNDPAHWNQGTPHSSVFTFPKYIGKIAKMTLPPRPSTRSIAAVYSKVSGMMTLQRTITAIQGCSPQAFLYPPPTNLINNSLIVASPPIGMNHPAPGNLTGGGVKEYLNEEYAYWGGSCLGSDNREFYATTDYAPSDTANYSAPIQDTLHWRFRSPSELGWTAQGCSFNYQVPGFHPYAQSPLMYGFSEAHWNSTVDVPVYIDQEDAHMPLFGNSGVGAAYVTRQPIIPRTAAPSSYIDAYFQANYILTLTDIQFHFRVEFDKPAVDPTFFTSRTQPDVDRDGTVKLAVLKQHPLGLSPSVSYFSNRKIHGAVGSGTGSTEGWEFEDNQNITNPINNGYQAFGGVIMQDGSYSLEYQGDTAQDKRNHYLDPEHPQSGNTVKENMTPATNAAGVLHTGVHLDRKWKLNLDR